MKTSQEIAWLILKFMHSTLFNEWLTMEELEWKKRFDAYNLHTKRNIRIDTTPEKKTILVWTSFTEKVIACYVNPEGIVFSDAGVYEGGYIFDALTYFNGDIEKVEIITQEILETESFLEILTRKPLRLE